MRKVLKNKVVKYAVTAAMVMSVMMTTACNSKIKVDYGYNPTDYVELGDYKGIQAEVDVTAITNQVGYTGTSGGLSIDDFTGSDYSMTLGKDAFPVAGTGLDEELYGMVAGQTKVITITLPENSKYSDYAGKRVVFELTMSYVQQANVPMLTDAFVKSAFNCETVDSYKAHVKNDVSGTIETKITEAKNEAILTQLLDKCKVTGYPEEFLAQQSSKLEESISFYSTLQGKTNDEYCQNLYGMTFDEFVKASAGQQLVYQAIAEKEGLAITDYEYKDDLEQFAKDSGYSKVDTFTDKYDKETIVKSMLVKKAQNLVMDNAVITEK